MPRRYFKRLSRQRHTYKARWFMRPFKAFLEHPSYWSLHRKSVTRAVALGMSIAFIPLPIHVPLVTVCALLLRVNVPVAIATTFVNNPLTIVPLFYCAYWTGSTLLGVPMNEFDFELSWQWLQTGLLPIWKPFLLGCAALGLTAAVLSYILLGGLWHLTLVLKYHERKRDGRVKKSANAEK
jgi:uncharacterized protein (DUF2062 family)